MSDCEIVDPGNKMFYLNVETELMELKKLRLENYVLRHGLYIDFIKEDKAGKR